MFSLLSLASQQRTISVLWCVCMNESRRLEALRDILHVRVPPHVWFQSNKPLLTSVSSSVAGCGFRDAHSEGVLRGDGTHTKQHLFRGESREDGQNSAEINLHNGEKSRMEERMI